MYEEKLNDHESGVIALPGRWCLKRLADFLFEFPVAREIGHKAHRSLH
jgi:hypothetical protein